MQTGLSANTASAYHRIFAVNQNGDSPASAASVYPVYTLAKEPADLTVNAVYTSSATISWGVNSNPGGTRYGLSYSTNTDFSAPVSTPAVFSSGLTANTTDVFNLNSETTYYFRVWAYNGNEIITAFSNTVSTTTLELMTPPDAPSGFAGAAVASTSINWSWNLAAGATAYYIYDETAALVGTVYAPGVSWTEAGLDPNDLVLRWIKAGNNYGRSASSSSASAYTYAEPPSALGFNNVTMSSVTLSWSAGARRTKYSL